MDRSILPRPPLMVTKRFSVSINGAHFHFFSTCASYHRRHSTNLSTLPRLASQTASYYTAHRLCQSPRAF